jgi:hypothetical protein
MTKKQAPWSRRQSRASNPAKSFSGLSSMRSALIGAVLIYLFHSAGLILLFHPAQGLFNKQPVIEQDWGLHFHHLHAMEGFWHQDKTLWGYNPYFMGGYPSNTIQDMSIKCFEMLAVLASGIGINVVFAFKLLAFLAASAVPWMLFFAVRNFLGHDIYVPLACFLAALLGAGYWWNSFPREMFFYGMLGFPPASCLMILSASLFYRALKARGAFTLTHLAWAASLAILLPMHLQAAIILVLPVIFTVIFCRKQISIRGVLWLSAGAVMAICVNLFWLIPLFKHRIDDISPLIVKQIPIFLSSDPFAFIKDYLGLADYWSFRTSFWERGLRWILLLLGLGGSVRLLSGKHKDRGLVFLFTTLSLFVLTYFGSFVQFFEGWQPLRFKIPCDFFLVLPAAFLISKRKQISSSKIKIGSIYFLSACGFFALAANIIQTESRLPLRLRTQFAPEIEGIVKWIDTETSKDARILFEESGDETGFFYNGMYLSSFLPHLTGSQLIGGPINIYNDRHHFAEFHSGILFKRDITTLTDEELASYFRAYNIDAAIAFHPNSVKRLLALQNLVSLEKTIGPVHLMKIKQPSTWFLNGEGKANVEWNRIYCSAVKGEEVILKYHWVENIISSPPLEIKWTQVLDDPIPFIKILHPPSEFTLSIGR